MKKFVWSRILKFEKRDIFNHQDNVVYNQMTTDGFSCSLLLVSKNKEYGE